MNKVEVVTLFSPMRFKRNKYNKVGCKKANDLKVVTSFSLKRYNSSKGSKIS